MQEIESPKVLIIENGSQTTQLIGRLLRDIGVRSVIKEPKAAEQWLEKNRPQAVILSGGQASVHDMNAPQPPRSVLHAKHPDGSPVALLCICYGMQWAAQLLGGTVASVHEHRSYGKDTIAWDFNNPFLAGTPETGQQVWMSHGDSVIDQPEGFVVLARTASGTIAAIGNYETKTYGVQFHPEVTHTEFGRRMLENFVFNIAGCKKDWIAGDMIEVIRSGVLGSMGPDDKAIFGFSGGVDSSTLAATLAPALAGRLRAVTIDGGQLREGELEEIEHHASLIGVQHVVINERTRFAAALADVTDAEEKRSRFKKLYSTYLQDAGRDFGATWLIQGSLAPDKIESGHTGGAMIKTHHNIGLDTGLLDQLHPFDHLFKYEVRDLARALGLPESICEREPFPGPGLFLRILGVPVTPVRLDIVRWADAQTRAILDKHGMLTEISQLVVALNGVDTVGVKGDARAYAPSIVIRAVRTIDFMTAEGVYFPERVAKELCSALTKHPQIARAWFDPTDKPPGTTEFE